MFLTSPFIDQAITLRTVPKGNELTRRVFSVRSQPVKILSISSCARIGTAGLEVSPALFRANHFLVHAFSLDAG